MVGFRMSDLRPMMYEVIENAGMYNQVQVDEFESIKKARAYVKEYYTADEAEEMHIDITFNGSTEY